MNALLLAAGMGTRLRPLTDNIPKCLVEIGGRPLLGIWLDDLSENGFDRFYVNTHYLAETVSAFVAEHPRRAQIILSREERLLGTAGTLKANANLIKTGTTLVAHADNFCKCLWNEFLTAHESRPRHAVMTMMTFRTPNPQSCGVVEVDEQGMMVAFHEKVNNPPGNLANAAVYLLDAEFGHLMEQFEHPVFDISRDIIPKLVGRVFTYFNSGTLIDVGTPADLARANNIAILERQRLLEGGFELNNT